MVMTTMVIDDETPSARPSERPVNARPGISSQHAHYYCMTTRRGSRQQ